jgi:prepilin-type N-terminal cleavage/methylation domain-containing protein
MPTIMPVPDAARQGARSGLVSFLSLVLTDHRFAPNRYVVGRSLYRRAGDGGFTMIESLVAIAVISVLMASLGTYFVSSMKVSRIQAQIQAAARIAQGGMELARGFGGPTLLVGRAACGSCIDVTAYDTDGYLKKTQPWNAAVSGVTPAVPIPHDLGDPVAVNGITYYRYYFVGLCWQPEGGGPCTEIANKVKMVRLVVGVTWTEAGCRYAMCIQVATALFSADPTDPLYTRS